MKRALALLLSLALTVAGCSKKTPSEKKQDSLLASQTATSPAPPPAIRVIDGLQGPESVLYDPGQDVYFISNINGGELAVDGNGFISRVNAATLSVDLKWIESGRNGVHLDGPKGMTIMGDTLFVSDVTAVRKFDRRTGAPQGAIPIPGATFINDLTNDGKRVYMSDTGVKLGPAQTFIRTGTEAIWAIDGNRATKIAAGDDLKEPNGLDFVDGKLWVVSFGTNELYELDGGRKTNVTNLPHGELDGLVQLSDGTRLISSWQGNAIYRGRPGGEFSAVLEAIDAPADIGYDGKRGLLLVPHSGVNQVTIHEIR